MGRAESIVSEMCNLNDDSRIIHRILKIILNQNNSFEGIIFVICVKSTLSKKIMCIYTTL